MPFTDDHVVAHRTPSDPRLLEMSVYGGEAVVRLDTVGGRV